MLGRIEHVRAIEADSVPNTKRDTVGTVAPRLECCVPSASATAPRCLIHKRPGNRKISLVSVRWTAKCCEGVFSIGETYAVAFGNPSSR